MDALKEDGIRLLWERFINRINNTWQEKYSSYGAALETVDAPTKFAQAVYADMVSYFTKNRINAKVVNPLTLHRYFQQGGFPLSIKSGTLDLFSMYLGYKWFSDFIEKNKASIVPKEGNSSGENKAKPLNMDPVEEAEITALIRGSNALQFQLYKSVPHTKDMLRLSNYFTSEGPAIQLIKGYIDKTLRNRRKLRVSGSFFDILHIKIIAVTYNKAEVETEEKWRLLWYDMKTNKDKIIYDVLNRQTYYLRKIEGKWKIHLNEYPGKAENILD